MGTCNDCKHNHMVWDPELGEFGGYPDPCYSCMYPEFNNWEPKEAELEPKPYKPKNMDDIYNVLNLILEELRNGKKED